MSLPEPYWTDDAPRTAATTCTGVEEWYAPTLLSAPMLGERAASADAVRGVLDVYDRIGSDDYVDALRNYYTAGLDRYGDGWRYADLVTALWAACDSVRPNDYLEIGVRRGRSMAVVGACRSACRMVGFDLWKTNYAGMVTPGPDFVRSETRAAGHEGSLELIGGNSHETVPSFLAAHPDAWFDAITVDGDHSREGAAQDLATVLPRLRVGGVLLFDDISHPKHPYLHEVWRFYTGDAARFSTWAYTDLGYGIGIAVRKG